MIFENVKYYRHGYPSADQSTPGALLFKRWNYDAGWNRGNPIVLYHDVDYAGWS